jgi:hypothetical protein
MVKGIAAIITINFTAHVTAALRQILAAVEPANSVRRKKFAAPSQWV